MNPARYLVEKRAGVRFHFSRIGMPLLRVAFGHIGRGTVIVRPLQLQGVAGISLGHGVIVRDGAWLACEGANGRLSVGSSTYIGHRCHVHAMDPVSIGRRCVIADNVLITSADHGRHDRHSVRGTGPVVIGDDVFLGQNVVVLGGVRIGDGATVAAGAVVAKDVGPGEVVGGVPARSLRVQT